MTKVPSAELEHLADAGHLKREPPAREEFEGLLRSASARLTDAQRDDLSPESRFDLAYNAAHALALAALRWHGYRADKRYLVFQVLVHTLSAPATTSRLLAKCHQQRNQAEYEGVDEVDAALLNGLIQTTVGLLQQVRSLPLPGP